MRVGFVIASWTAGLLLTGCPPTPTEPPLPDEIGNIVNATDPVSRLQALDEALGAARQRNGQTPVAICAAVGALEGVATASTSETFARRLVLYLGLVRCPATEPLLRDCAAAIWTSRSGILRASALATLADGAVIGAFQPGAARGLAETLATDPATLVRVSAFRVLLADPTAPDASEWSALALEDESELVRHTALGVPAGGAP